MSIATIAVQGFSPTMTSLDLLDLINAKRVEFGESPVRRNDFLARVIDELDGEHYESFVVTNPNGTTTDVLKLSADQCALVAMRESKGVRRAVRDQLEAKAPKLPQTFAQALMLAAQQAEQIEQQAAQLAIAAPAVAFVDKYVEATGLKGFREVCKLLGANEARFREFLQDTRVMYRLGGEWTAYQPQIDAGRIVSRTGEKDGFAFTSVKFTPKGISWIAGEWAKHGLKAKAEAV